MIQEDAHEPIDVAAAPLPAPQKKEEPQPVEDNEPISLKNNPHPEGLVRTPIVSIAHKAKKAPASKPSSVTKVDQIPESEEAAKGLASSMHARPYRQYQNLLQEDPSSVKMENCNRDTMEFFDTKQKEYHPPSPKAMMLQSKDPNAPMHKKSGSTSKLNPEAKEYARMPLAEPIPPTTIDRQPKATEEVAGTGTFDMTPMLNVLGARTMKASGVPPAANEQVVDPLLELLVQCGVTRAVRVEGVDLDVNMRTLQEMGCGGPPARELEGISDNFSGGVRNVVFRFAGIQDAVAFRSSVLRDERWKTKVEFVKDL